MTLMSLEEADNTSPYPELSVKAIDHQMLKENQRIMMNIPTPKGKAATENTKERMLSSEVTDIPPGVNHRYQGIVYFRLSKNKVGNNASYK